MCHRLDLFKGWFFGQRRRQLGLVEIETEGASTSWQSRNCRVAPSGVDKTAFRSETVPVSGIEVH
jgi:hypothetical protein